MALEERRFFALKPSSHACSGHRSPAPNQSITLRE